MKILKQVSILSLVFMFLAVGVVSASANTADLEAEFLGRNRPFPNTPYRYRVRVTNNGTVNADNVSISIDMPITNTSPNQFILGTVTDLDSRCQINNLKIECNIGRVKATKRKTIRFNLELPVANKSQAMTATVATTTNETNLSNNEAVKDPNMRYVQNVITDGNILFSACVGTGLTSYFSCLKFPSSLQTAVASLNSNGSVDYTNRPTLSGSWYQPNPKELHISTSDNGNQISEFNGFAVSGTCFEGLTTYPNSSTYVAPTRVCLQ